MRQRRPLRTLKYAILLIYSLFCLIPFAWMISASLKPAGEVLRIPMEWIPSHVQWGNFPKALFDPRFAGYNLWNFGVNSIAVAVNYGGLNDWPLGVCGLWLCQVPLPLA